MIEHRREKRHSPFRQVVVDSVERRFYRSSSLLRVEQVSVDCSEKGWIQLHRLWDHFPVRELSSAEYLHLRKRRGGIKDKESGVLEVVASEKPFVRFLQGTEYASRRIEQLNLCVALSDLAEQVAERSYALVVGIKQLSLCQK